MISDKRRAEILRDLHIMKLQMESYENLDIVDPKNGKSKYLQRNGSVRGRRNLVKEAVRKMARKIEVTSDNFNNSPNADTKSGVVVYLTTCGIMRRVYDKCKSTVQLLESLHIRYEVRDLNIDGFLIEQLMEKLKVFEKEFVYGSLPIVYVDGFYLGDEKDLVELNDRKLLTNIIGKYKTLSKKCEECGNRGYVVCRNCHGSRRHNVSGKNSEGILEKFEIRLRCSYCDQNGISRCPKCCFLGK